MSTDQSLAQLADAAAHESKKIQPMEIGEGRNGCIIAGCTKLVHNKQVGMCLQHYLGTMEKNCPTPGCPSKIQQQACFCERCNANLKVYGVTRTEQKPWQPVHAAIPLAGISLLRICCETNACVAEVSSGSSVIPLVHASGQPVNFFTPVEQAAARMVANTPDQYGLPCFPQVDELTAANLLANVNQQRMIQYWANSMVLLPGVRDQRIIDHLRFTLQRAADIYEWAISELKNGPNTGPVQQQQQQQQPSNSNSNSNNSSPPRKC